MSCSAEVGFGTTIKSQLRATHRWPGLFAHWDHRERGRRGFPKISGMFVGGSTMRIIVLGGPYWVLPILGNYQRFQHDVEINCAQILYSPCRI